jgi:hypothetical protein
VDVKKLEETKMTTCAPSTSCDNPGEDSKEKAKTMFIGSCVLCWGVVGFLVIVGSVSKLLGLY